MKKYLILVLFSIWMVVGNAQKMKEDANLLSLGIGGVPGIGANLSYDYGLSDLGPGVITIGAFAGGDTRLNTYNDGNNTGNYTRSEWFFAPRISYQYDITLKWEVYAAFMAGIFLERYHYSNHLNVENRRKGGNSFSVAITAGVRYTISQKFAVFLEAGKNISYLNLGISFNF